jgi:putative endonuclease
LSAGEEMGPSVHRSARKRVGVGHFVYVLRCSDDTLYTGYTTDLPRRLADHNKGRGSKYTRGRLPTVLMYFEKFPSKGGALRRENEIKKMKREAKLLLTASLKSQ